MWYLKLHSSFDIGLSETSFLFLRSVSVFLLAISVFGLKPLERLADEDDLYSIFSDEKKHFYKDKVKEMFYHAYDGYMRHAYPMDELKPLSCAGQETWGSFSLTLVDSLDMLAILENGTEFNNAVNLVLQNIDMDKNVNVSVFETNIRIIGGLLSAHMLSSKFSDVHPGWPCSGPLLDMAEKFAQKLMPAFNTETGMPFGTINLKYGLDIYETPITCTAGVGTFLLEFGTLTRLTGNPLYEKAALKALDSLYKLRSAIGLVGNHVDIQSGEFTATDSGIGAGIDSYYEYLVKGGLLFQRPELLKQFYEYEEAVNTHVRKGDWFVWASYNKGQVTLPIFQSLEAFWPGLLVLLDKIEDASRIMLTYSQVLKQYGFPSEFYNIPNREAVSHRTGYPLRPEMAESLMYLYRATKNSIFLELAAGLIEAIEYACKTSCGYATVKDVTMYTLEDRMESFFLAETLKYLYLIFDEDNFIHGDGSRAKTIETTNGQCFIEAGGYIFNTEAHPIDPGILYCCSKKRQQDIALFQEFENRLDLSSLLDLDDSAESEDVSSAKELIAEKAHKWQKEEVKKEEGNNPPDSLSSILRSVTDQIKRIAKSAKERNKKQNLERNKMQEEARKNSRRFIVFCPNCSTLLDQYDCAGSEFLQMFLGIIYHPIYQKHGLTVVRGPACLDSDAPHLKRYTKDIPAFEENNEERSTCDTYNPTFQFSTETGDPNEELFRLPVPPFSRKFLIYNQVIPLPAEH